MRFILLALAALSLAGCVVEPLHGYHGEHEGHASQGPFFHHQY